MKKKSLCQAIALFALILLALSCKKSGSGKDTITYEVRITSGTWSGDYFDYSDGNQALKFVNNKPDGWKFSFTPPKGQQVGLLLSAIPDNSGTVVTANIYKNGQIIASDSGPYGANAQIIINP
jgi:hypothetical protein